jgi:hypothetical protein
MGENEMIKVVSMMYMLILVYLFIFNGDKTVKVFNSVGGQITSMTKAFQGR